MSGRGTDPARRAGLGHPRRADRNPVTTQHRKIIHPTREVFAERAARWARSSFHREELPARAYYAADAGGRDALDGALFAAAWAEGLDVNEPETIR